LRRAKFPIIHPDLRLDCKVATHPVGRLEIVSFTFNWHGFGPLS
jgi:hypothetical protein